jgi:hypothetical protein
MIMNAKPSLRAISGDAKAQGSIEISAPGALYAVDFWRTEEKIRSELLPPAAADPRLGYKIDGDEIKKRRRQTVHRTGAAPALSQILF